MADRKAATTIDAKENVKDDGSKTAKDKDDTMAANNNNNQHKSPKKRRKVNHACVYCRRSHMTCDLERPCTRCIKRNIGHLCHDEPRDADSKKNKSATQGAPSVAASTIEDSQDARSDVGRSSVSSTMGPPPVFDGTGRPRASSGFGAGLLGQRNTLPLVQQAAAAAAAAGLQGNSLGTGASGNANQFAGFSDAWMTAQNFQDMNNYNPNYMIAPEVSHEFNLLNDFLHTSLLDDSGVAPDDTSQNQAFVRAMKQEMLSGFGGPGMAGGAGQAANMPPGSMMPPPNLDGSAGPHPINAMQIDKDKTREYYLQAADPSGSDNPEERMLRVLKAKYDAGLLKPFNYINGYARLGKYLDGHIAASSKQKILRTINQFRPKFREKAQGLTDIQLVYVEMWFERQLMDYDRVFASMAVPACCWRRTGEIFRGNKEMAELIHVPVNQLRDGNIALHEILTEESMVRYWEEFGTIAFDPAHDTLLTACSLKHPSDSSDHPVVKCCFSFTIRKDDHKLPALIVGNFLPHDPPSPSN